MDGISQRHSVAAADNHDVNVGDGLDHSTTDDNINVNALEQPQHPALYHHYHYGHQQQYQSDEMRRKLTQWCRWRRRYGVLSSFCIADELQRPRRPAPATPH